MNNWLKEMKLSRAKKKEVIIDTLDNLKYLEVRELLKKIIVESSVISEKTYNYLIEEHKEKLIDSLIYNEVIKEEE